MAQGVVEFAPINISASGDNTIVAGVSGKRLFIVNYALVANGTVAVKFKSGSTDISGAMPLVVNSGISANGLKDAPLMEITLGQSLIINLSAAVAVLGHIAYVVTGG